MPVKGSIIPPNVQSLQASQTHTHKKNQHICSEKGHFIPSPFQSKEMHGQEQDRYQKNEHQFLTAVSPMVSNTRQSQRTHEDSLRAHRRAYFRRIFVLMLLLRLFHGVNGILSKHTLRANCSDLSKTQGQLNNNNVKSPFDSLSPKKAW